MQGRQRSDRTAAHPVDNGLMIYGEHTGDAAQGDAAGMKAGRLLAQGKRIAVAPIFHTVVALAILTLVSLGSVRRSSRLRLTMFAVAGRTDGPDPSYFKAITHRIVLPRATVLLY